MIHFFGQADHLGGVWEFLLEALLSSEHKEHVNICFREKTFEGKRLVWVARRYTNSLVYFSAGNTMRALALDTVQSLLAATLPGVFVSVNQRLNQEIVKSGLLDQAADELGEQSDILIVTHDGDSSRVQQYSLTDMDLLRDFATKSSAANEVYDLSDDRRQLQKNDAPALMLEAISADNATIRFRGNLYAPDFPVCLKDKIAGMDFSHYLGALPRFESADRNRVPELAGNAKYAICKPDKMFRASCGEGVSRISYWRYPWLKNKLTENDVVMLVSRKGDAQRLIAEYCFRCGEQNLVRSVAEVTPRLVSEQSVTFVPAKELFKNPGQCLAAVRFSGFPGSLLLSGIMARLINISLPGRRL